MTAKISFNRPTLAGREMEYLERAVRNGHISGDGEFTHRCQSLLERELGARKALLTTSCTDALEMAAILLEVQPGDEVIVPSFTFVSTVNAFVLRGAKPIFVDVRPDTLNLDERLIEKHLSPRTKAIVPVHYAGVGCEMDAILEISAKLKVPVVEDNAHGLFGSYRGRPLGSFGSLATQSFHETKNFSCGEGGVLLINDEAFVERAEIIREKGTNRSRFFRGQVDKYGWVDLGSSFLPSDLLAAYLLAQLEAKDTIQSKRERIWNRYSEGLHDWAERSNVSLPHIPKHCGQAFHMFYMLLPNLEIRQRLIAHLKAQNILAVFHYLPLHASEFGRKLGGHPGQCPVTEDVSDRLLRLPFYNDLSPEDQARVIEVVTSFEV